MESGAKKAAEIPSDATPSTSLAASLPVNSKSHFESKRRGRDSGHAASRVYIPNTVCSDCRCAKPLRLPQREDSALS
jgi:hypothetical protein